MQQRKHLFLAGIAFASMRLALGTFLQIPNLCVSGISMVYLRSTQRCWDAFASPRDIILPKDHVCIVSLVSILRGALSAQNLQCHAGFSVVICSACNLASPIVSGILFEILTGRQPMSRYPYFLGVMATLYTVEPLLTRVYIKNVCIAGEKVCHIKGTIYQSTLHGQP